MRRQLTDDDFRAWQPYGLKVATKAWLKILGRRDELGHRVLPSAPIDVFHHLQAEGPKKLGAPSSSPASARTTAPPARRLSLSELAEVAKAAAYAEGEEAALAYVNEVGDLCAMAGFANLATEFVARSVPIEAIRSRLLDMRAAKTDANPISSHDPGKPSPERLVARGWAQAVDQVAGSGKRGTGYSPAGAPHAS